MERRSHAEKAAEKDEAGEWQEPTEAASDDTKNTEAESEAEEKRQQEAIKAEEKEYNGRPSQVSSSPSRQALSSPSRPHTISRPFHHDLNMEERRRPKTEAEEKLVKGLRKEAEEKKKRKEREEKKGRRQRGGKRKRKER